MATTRRTVDQELGELDAASPPRFEGAAFEDAVFEDGICGGIGDAQASAAYPVMMRT